MTLREVADRFGIVPRWMDQLHRTRDVPEETMLALLAAMGVDPDAPPDLPAVHVVEAGAHPDLDVSGAWRLHLEDGTTREGPGALPALPMGRHRLEADGAAAWILSAPARLALPAPGWGVTLPLYALKGPGGAVGDYLDLRDAMAGLAALGAGFVGINPIHAGFASDPGSISPYSPSHRRRFSVRHIRAGAGGAEGVDGAAATGGQDALIDYAADEAARTQALRQGFAAADPAALDAFLAEGGEELRRFATYEALAAIHGPRWGDWPAPLQDPAGPAAHEFAAAHRDALRYHAWLQMQAEAQLAEVRRAGQDAGMSHGIYLDLAVGTHPHGAETWVDPRAFARDVSLGAPPDAFSKDGQVWGVAPFDPLEMRRSGFAALAATLRAQFRVAGMLRVDHILGFDRAFWVPRGMPGAYVRMPREAMLAVVRIEAARAGAVVVGEDLGNVPDGLRDALASSGIMGCAVAQFEIDLPAAEYPEAALASFGTHDLPTYLGWRSARDIEVREQVTDFDDGDAARVARARDVERFDGVVGRDATVDAMHAFVAATPARLVAVQAEDALGIVDQPNLPGTTDAYPNWRRPLPVAAAELAAQPGLRRAAEIMAAAGRRDPGTVANGSHSD